MCANTGMRLAIIAHRLTRTNVSLTSWPTRAPLWQQLTPGDALATLDPGDVALGRLDVLPTLDGVDEGLWALAELETRGVRVLNGDRALLACHDKLVTARELQRAGLPHPETRLLGPAAHELAGISGPTVVKPRFGSWGAGVTRCDDPVDLQAHLEVVAQEEWFRANGALVQDLVPPLGYDLRIVVAAGRVVGAVKRISAEGEWRTNVALGARRAPAEAPLEARELAVLAARAVDAQLVGVDLLPDGRGGWTILELNGAVEFTRAYARRHDVFALVATELAHAALGLDSQAPRRELVKL